MIRLNENTNQTLKSHNVVIVMITVTCFGAMVECITQGWEFWVAPLIGGGIIASWVIHVNHYNTPKFRENFYIIYCMLVSFYHGVHDSSFFDVIVISVLLMVTAAVLKRKEFMPFILIEFFIIMISQLIILGINGGLVFDSLTVSRIVLHFVVELCVYSALIEMLNSLGRVEDNLDVWQKSEENEKTGMEDFLANISHELRTPVNVISGMSTLILKKEDRDDVKSIREAGLRLSHQIEDIQDYTEIQRGNAILEEDKYMITSILNDIVSNFNMMNIRKDMEFVIDLDPEVPAMMKGDVKKINKIIIHLLENAFKFSRRGGVYLRVTGIKREYGENLIIEVTDTGIGMTDRDKDKVSKGSYQSNRKRNRSTGGIGLGLSIVYGFTRLMNGFVSIDAVRGKGTTVRVSIVQEILDPTPCLLADSKQFMSVAFHVALDRFKVPRVREFYKDMASNLAKGLRVNLYSAPTIKELNKLLASGNITHVFMGQVEYRNNSKFFDDLAETGLTVAVAGDYGFKTNIGSKVIVIPKPLYGFPVTKILNGEKETSELLQGNQEKGLDLSGVRALIVDDEPMNLVVATGLFREYDMVIDTAESGKESLYKFENNNYDVIFMDHMMPEMDGVETMKRLRLYADQTGKHFKIIALTANAMSGAREMFLKEGFDGFISKPININDFERVMSRVMYDRRFDNNGGNR